MLGEEGVAKAEKNITMRMSLARFPFVKSLESFDVTYQPSLDKKQIQQVATCHVIEYGANLVILGPPGVGKSHLAIGLGLNAIKRGYRVMFTTAAAMIATFTRALTEKRLEDKLKRYTIPRVLIIDEIGYLPIDRTGANLFFQLISRRYEKGPMILTSSQSVGAWGKVFDDRVLATAISIGSCLTRSRSISATIPTGSRRSSKPDSCASKKRQRQPNRGGDFSMTLLREIWVPLDTPRTDSPPRSSPCLPGAGL